MLYIPNSFTICPTCDMHRDQSYDPTASGTATFLSCQDDRCGPCDSYCGVADDDLGSGDVCTPRNTATTQQCDEEAMARLCADWDPPNTVSAICREACTQMMFACRQHSDNLSRLRTQCHGSCCDNVNHCRFHSQYGDGSGVAGSLVQDEVGLGNGMDKLKASVWLGSFDLSRDMDGGGTFEPQAIDGIWGIGGAKLADGDGIRPALDVILESNQLNNVFALCLGGHSDNPSTWDIGEIDTTKHIGEIVYVPFLHHGSEFDYYTVAAPSRVTIRASSISAASSDLSISESDFGTKSTAIIDSGTSSLLLATPVYTSILNALSSGTGISADARAQGYLLRSTDATAQMPCFVAPPTYTPAMDYPALQFWFKDTSDADFALELSPHHYLRNYTGTDGDVGVGMTAWCTAFSDGDDESIFGDTFMQAFYSVFDRNQYVVGFAPVSNACGHHVQGTTDNPIWPLRGCTDSSFVEFSSAANADDGSCHTLIREGCLDQRYVEYDAAATVDTTPSACCSPVLSNTGPVPRWNPSSRCSTAANCESCNNCCSASNSGCGTDTCQYSGDDECDDGSQGGTQYCPLGSDCTDCGN
eukprot:COSAG01_NODE_9755_length_2352_cov_2.110519_1_plen_585_part_10